MQRNARLCDRFVRDANEMQSLDCTSALIVCLDAPFVHRKGGIKELLESVYLTPRYSKILLQGIKGCDECSYKQKSALVQDLCSLFDLFVHGDSFLARMVK